MNDQRYASQEFQTPDQERFVFRTTGVCPLEIHFKVRDRAIGDVRFVGGGCPGNAALVGRLLEGMNLDQALTRLSGIECRNGTSCPDQLARAITEVLSGTLEPASSYRIEEDLGSYRRVALIGDISGDGPALASAVAQAHDLGVDAVFAVGNLIGAGRDNAQVIQLVKKWQIKALTGALDFRMAGKDESEQVALSLKDRDFLLRLPQVRTFGIGPLKVAVFFGDYLCRLEGFSDFDPMALEINMVTGLAGFMEDEAVFPALEAMTPQFQAGVVIFGQPRRWGFWTLGQVSFVGLGPVRQNRGVAFGLLEWQKRQLHFRVVEHQVSEEE